MTSESAPVPPSPHQASALTPEAQLLAAFSSRSAIIGVVGLGYVGLPLAKAMLDAGFRVVGFDIDPAKIAKLRRGEAYLKHLGDALAESFKLRSGDGRFLPTCEPGDLAACDAICICVPTPLGKHHEPDLSYVENSTRMIAGVFGRAGGGGGVIDVNAKGTKISKASERSDSRDPGRTREFPTDPDSPGDNQTSPFEPFESFAFKPILISLESTTYPRTTREVVLPILEQAGRTLGKDVFVCFSPEREDPGREGVSTSSIPRLVGGLDDASTRVGAAMYSAAVRHVTPVASAEIAEAAKLLENIYRAVNIALVNELKPVLMDMGIDIWQVIDAASTKPFGFQRFEPGPGLGGHCIPIDPYYLTWKAREYGHTTRFIELAGEINHRMPVYVVERTQAALNDEGKSLKGSRVLILGIAYKPDVDDIRETPAAAIIELLMERGASVAYHDPHVARFPSMRKHAIDLGSMALSPELLREQDAVVVVTHHRAIDWAMVGEHARLVIDTRNALSRWCPAARLKARVVKA